MVDAAPFRALRYDPAVAGDPRATSAPAADDIDRFDYARHRTASPYTVLELLAPRPGDGYAAAGAALRRWSRTGVLTRDERAAYYVYEQRGVHVQRGVLAAVGVDPDEVVPHEDVDPARVAARVERLLAVPVDPAPVFTVAPPLAAPVRALLDDVLRGPPLVELTDEAGARHRVVACTDPDRVAGLRAALAGVRVLIADGHHRYAAAQALGRRAGVRGRTLALVVDTAVSEPQVLPVHRVLPGLPADWRSRLAPEVVAAAVPADPADLAAALAGEPAGTVALSAPEGGFLLRPVDLDGLRRRLPAERTARWRALDTALVDEVLLPRLGVDRTAVLALADLVEAAEAVRHRGGALVLVRPVPLATVRALAAGGELLPAKTTSFRPKPRAGLVMRALDDG